jgi:pyruvate formate-lyase activating enzyme-like uncharacterized protein
MTLVSFKLMTTAICDIICWYCALTESSAAENKNMVTSYQNEPITGPSDTVDADECLADVD